MSRTRPGMLGAVFLSGVLFLAITLLGVHAWLAKAISPSLKHSFYYGGHPRVEYDFDGLTAPVLGRWERTIAFLRRRL